MGMEMRSRVKVRRSTTNVGGGGAYQMAKRSTQLGCGIEQDDRSVSLSPDFGPKVDMRVVPVLSAFRLHARRLKLKRQSGTHE